MPDAASRHPELIVRQAEPFNAGPPLARLRQSLITPNDLFYIRSHGAVPSVDAARYRLKVSGRVERPHSFSLAELQALPNTSLTASLLCAGNRRDELIAIKPVPGETPWGAEAVSTAVWTGARLGDVLRAAGAAPGGGHAAMLGLDAVEAHGAPPAPFGGSIPLAQALEGEALLAWEMNGQPLPPEHGYPLRAIIPGVIGARSVKWLAEISVQAEPSRNYYQVHAYKLFPPQAGPDDADWECAPMLAEYPVNAVICEPGPGARLPAGPTQVRGYALAGGGVPLAWVDVSADGGRAWQLAEPGEDAGRWAWRLWSARVTLPRGPAELVVRARDAHGNQQPAEVAAVWNFKGYLNNAWHRVRVVGV
ncbi:MAG: molybdopterin-dependent oxidoreductase [Anaerolineales bacterium]